MGQFRAPLAGPETPVAEQTSDTGPHADRVGVAAGGVGAKKSHPLLATFYALFLVGLASFGGGRLWDVIRARRDYLNLYFTVVAETREAFAEALRTNQKMPRANPALPHVIAVYPPLAQRLGEQGDVTLRVLVLPNGLVGDVRLMHSSGFTQLDAAALVGVGSWYYIPAVKDHHPVGTWTVVLVRFRIRGNPI